MAVREPACDHFTFETPFGDLDLLGYVEPLGDYDAISANAEIMDIGGISLKIIGLDDLIRIKEYIRRPKDQDSLFQLRPIKRIRSERKER